MFRLVCRFGGAAAGIEAEQQEGAPCPGRVGVGRKRSKPRYGVRLERGGESADGFADLGLVHAGIAEDDAGAGRFLQAVARKAVDTNALSGGAIDDGSFADAMARPEDEMAAGFGAGDVHAVF